MTLASVLKDIQRRRVTLWVVFASSCAGECSKCATAATVDATFVCNIIALVKKYITGRSVSWSGGSVADAGHVDGGGHSVILET